MTSTEQIILPGRDDAEQWREGLFFRMFQLLHTFEQDNFDARRYRSVSPNAFFFDQHAGYFAFFVRNAERFHKARNALVDRASKELFDQLILFRILGHLHVRLPYNRAETREYFDITETWKTGQTADSGVLGQLAMYSVPIKPRPIRVKCWPENVAATFLSRQYYLCRDSDTIEPAGGDRILDVGGCFGDTALGFANDVGDDGHVYTFDPIRKHCEIIRENLALNPALASRISVFEFGLADEDCDGSRSTVNGDVIDPGANIVGQGMATRRIDSLVADGTLTRVDFIKMDVEGSELSALTGAEAAIRKWKPRLAISLYHKAEDLFTIPLWIDSLGLGYRMFLDHYSIHHEETVLYAQA